MRFDIHWSEVEPPLPPALAVADGRVVALWPAPVNADACFAAAGFTDFDDHGDAWDDAAVALLERVVERLSAFGEPSLLSPALPDSPPWHRRLRGEVPAPRPLLTQLELPMRWDSLPPCVVAFGTDGARLRTGEGHVILWLTLPHGVEPAEVVAGVAGGHPVRRTTLRWSALLPGV